MSTGLEWGGILSNFVKMLRLLHTSDWHLGHSLYSYDRSDEMHRMFDNIRDACLRLHPDALIIAGDIFDTPSPPAAVQRAFTDFLLELRAELPEMAIVAVAGNHDSASRLEIDSPLWRLQGVHVLGWPPETWSKDDPDCTDTEVETLSEPWRHIVVIPGKGAIAAIPYLPGRNSGAAPREKRILAEALAEMERVAPGLPKVAVGHMAVGKWCDDGRNNPDSIGNLTTLPSSIFSADWDYVALGHIHRRQIVAPNIAYSGSPYPVGFDEAYPHGGIGVTISAPGEVSLEDIDFEPQHSLLTLPSEPLPPAEALDSIAAESAQEGDFIRLNVGIEAELPADLNEQAAARCAAIGARFCTVKYTDLRRRSDDADRATFNDADEFRAALPADICRLFLTEHGSDSESIEQMTRLITEIHNRLNDED